MNNPEAAPTLALFDCPVCKERLSLPVTLPCGYSTCAPCLRGIVLSAKQSVETATSNVASPVTESPVSPTVPATAGQGTRDSSSSTSTTPAQPNPPQRMDSTTSITSNSSLIVDVSAGEKVYYPCPAPDCPYGDHLYRKEKTDFNLQRIIDGLPAGEKTREIQVDDIPMSELECPICYNLLVDPITAPCGHHACRECLLAAIDHGSANQCPTCRSLLPRYNHFFHRPPNKILTKLLTTLHTAELQKREQALLEARNAADEFVPIFVCNTILPKTISSWHIFEPRYRLMMHRAMSGNKRFGMTIHTRNGFAEYGTMLEIRAIEAVNPQETMNGLPRFLVNAFGVYRFRVLERGMRDGYHTAKIERIEDVDPEDEITSGGARSTATEEEWETESDEEGQEAEEGHGGANRRDPAAVRALAQQISTCRERVAELLASLGPLERHHFEAQYGSVPESDQDFSWYLGNVLFGSEEGYKMQLLKMTSLRKRMEFLMPFVDSLARGSSFSRCSIM